MELLVCHVQVFVVDFEAGCNFCVEIWEEEA